MLPDVGHGQDDVFGEAAGPVDADTQRVRAEVFATRPAVAAVAARDVALTGDALAELLASDFTAGDGQDRAAAVTYAKQMLFAYRALDLSVSDVKINRRGDSARATFRLKLTGVPSNFGGIGDLVPRQACYEFEISARVESGDWKFVTASWKEGPSS